MAADVTLEQTWLGRSLENLNQYLGLGAFEGLCPL